MARDCATLLKLEGLWLGDGDAGNMWMLGASSPVGVPAGEAAEAAISLRSACTAWRRSLMSTWNCRTSSERMLNYGGSKSACAVGGIRDIYITKIKT